MAGSRGFVLLVALYWAAAAVTGVEMAARRRPEHGLRVTGFESSYWTGKRVYDGLDATLSNELLGTRPFPNWAVYSLEWTGALVVTEPGTYRFSLASDDGSSLDIDGVTVVRNAGLDRRHAEFGSVTLGPGQHTVRLRYFQNGGRYGLNVLWGLAGHHLAPIPAAQLLPDVLDETAFRWRDVRAPLTGAATLAAFAALFVALGPWLRRVAVGGWGRAVEAVAAAVSRPAVAVALIVAAGVVPRVLLYLTTPAVLWPDAHVFYVTAINILHGDYASHDPYRTLVYPYFLTAFLKWSRSPAVGDLITVTQQELGLLTAVVVYVVSRRAFTPAVALAGALLFALHPLQLFYEISILTETLFTLTLVVTLWAAVRLFEHPHWRRAALLGLAAALLVLVRPVAQWFIAPIALVGWFALPAGRARLSALGVTLLCYAVPLLGWMTVNQQVYGFFGVSLGRGMGLYTRVFDIDRLIPPPTTKFRDVMELWSMSPGERWSPNRVRDELNYVRGFTGAAADDAMFGFALETIRTHPVAFAVGTIRQWVRQVADPATGVHACPSPRGTFLCGGRMEGESLPPFPNLPPPASHRLRAAVISVMTTLGSRFGAIVLLALVGMAAWCRSPQRNAAGALLILAAIYFTLVPALTQWDQDRFRLPADALFYLFAVWGLREIGVRALAATSSTTQLERAS